MRSNKFFTFVLALGVLSFSVSTVTTSASADDAWNFSIEPYVMVSSIDGDAGVGRVTGAEVAVDFDDILENLQSAFMVVIEAHHAGGWGIALDYGFMDLGADISGPLGGIIDADVRQGILELIAARRFDLANGYYEIIGGVRWWDNDVEVEVDPGVLPGSATASIEEDWIDPVVGIRFARSMKEKWKLVLRGDVGGFGAGSDFTASASGGVYYSFSETVSLDIQYKALWVDYEDGTKGTPGYFAYDTVTHGPILGIKFDF